MGISSPVQSPRTTKLSFSLSTPTDLHLCRGFISSHLQQTIMVSPDTPPQAASKGIESVCSPRISFSVESLEDDTNDFISINLLSNKVMREDNTIPSARNPDFEFLSNDHRTGPDMVTADELFYEGKLLPFWQMHHSETLKKLSLKTKEAEPREETTQGAVAKDEIHRVGNWFVDDDPSPRPPSCTILWKELLRLKKKQRASTLSPSSSGSLDMSSIKEEKAGNKERNAKPERKALERTKSTTISRIRPMVNVPICKTQGGRISSLPPLMPLRKARLDTKKEI